MIESLLRSGEFPGQISELLLDQAPGVPIGDNSLLHMQSAGQNKVTLIGHCLASKAEIIMAATRAGQSGDIRKLTELAGSYSGVFQTEESTTVFSDLAGQFPLYYRHTEVGIQVGRSSRELADTSNPELDRVSLAARLCLNMGYLETGYSLFEGVRRLEGGEALCSDSQKATLYSYDALTAKPGVDMQIAAAMTRHSLIDAVQRRLETGEITSDFSGGHDSPALAMLAATLGRRPVHSFVHYNTAYPAGDIKHACRLAALNSNIVLHGLEDGPREMPYSILSPEDIPFIPDEPYRGTENLGLELRRRQAVQKVGSSIHLVGVGGDALYDGQPALADLIRQGDIDRAWQQAAILGRLTLDTPKRCMEDAMRQSKLTLPHALQAAAEFCRQPDSLTPFSTGWLAPPTINIRWLTPEMRQLLAERAELQAQQVLENISMGDYETMTAIRNNGHAQLHVRYLDRQTYHAPFLDNNVIRAATQLDIFRRAPFDQFKPLLRKALSGRGVPRQVFERTTKGTYSPVTEAGQRQAIASIMGLLVHSRLAALHIIDPHAVRQSIEQRGLSKDNYYLEPFVATEIWLRQRELFEGSSAVELAAPDIAIPEFPAVSPETTNILSQQYAISPDQVFASGPVQMVAMDLRTGKYAALNHTAITVLQALNTGANGKTAVQFLAKQFPQLSLDQLQSEVAAVIGSFKTQGIVIDRIDNSSESRSLPEWPGPQLKRTPDIEKFRIRPLYPTERFFFSESDMDQGRQALHQAHHLSQQGLAATISFIQNIREATTSPSSEGAIRRDMTLIRKLSLNYEYNDQRIACYESSLATVIMAATRGQRVLWNIGVNFRPGPELHAWVEIDGEPVTISTDESVEGVYQRLFQL